MNGSIAAIITLGYGTFGSVNLLPTLGYGIGAAVAVSTVGPATIFALTVDSGISRITSVSSGLAQLETKSGAFQRAAIQ